MCNVALPTGRGSNPGTLSQWTKATGAPLQNKPCKDGWVEEGGGVPTCTIMINISLIRHQLRTDIHLAKMTIPFMPNSRGAVVRWLERLGYGAGKRRKVVSSRLGFAIRRLKSSLCQPNSKWVPSSNQRRIRQQKEKDGLCLSSAVPKIAPNVPTAIGLWETFIFTYYAENKKIKSYKLKNII